MVDVVESLQRDCRHVAYDYGALLPPDVPLSPRLTRSIPHGATAAQRGRIRPRRSLEYAYRLDHILEAPLAPSTRPCMYGGLRIHDSAGVPTDVFTGAGEKIVEYRAGANAVRYMPCTQPRCVDRRVCLPCISAYMRQSTGLTSRLHIASRGRRCHTNPGGTKRLRTALGSICSEQPLSARPQCRSVRGRNTAYLGLLKGRFTYHPI